ncbi:adenylate/guanylate cyclase domain-containing protein [Gracilimonas sp. Q87]|uniref:adenylate/guanylate cyclase domain-containing protein n=1 Tax=Gracilimonas sp. Q87 TaxID=3384766 RepID=UPI00398407DD
MKEGQQIHRWVFNLAASPAKLWPYVSDTNRIFRLLGAPPVQEMPLSRNTPKGYLELSHSILNSQVTWQEEPYAWETPFRFKVTRNYKVGFLEHLSIFTECIETDEGTKLIVKITVEPSNSLLYYPIRLYVNYVLKKKLADYLEIVDNSVSQGLHPYELNEEKSLIRGADKKIKRITKELEEKTKRKRIVRHLIELIRKAEDEDLKSIHPYSLARYWGEKKYSVLNVFLHATNLDLLDFSWDICCPKCKSPKNNFRKLQDTRGHLYCEDCNDDYIMDFNKNTHLVFKPHPLIRNVSNRSYCLGGPGSKPHRVVQQSLLIGDERYPELQLEEGTYLFRTHNHEGHLVFHVRENGTDNVNIYVTDEDFHSQSITISKNPNLGIFNHSSQPMVCFFDKLNWKEEAIYATEVCSNVDFNTLFPNETLKETSKVRASEVTMLFTDLMNSTELYVKEGDETAIGRVMGHFRVIQQIIAEERGGIVKTIGDSVMAVFWEPVSALKAVQRIQQIFSNSSAVGNAFKIKAGVHFGDCTAVNLNGRIDYFGTTVNLASRLVDAASEKEIMLSEALYEHPDIKLYLDKNTKTFFVKDSSKELKGFSEEEIKVKQIRLERPPMRLVI